MKSKVNQAWRAVLLFFLVIALVHLMTATAKAQEEPPVSKPGEYRGYSQPIYDEWVRISQYITVRDGTRLAVDIFRPAQNGRLVDEPLPVIWTHHRYHRADIREDKLITILDLPGLQTVLQHGYVVAAVDVRGGGASFGTRQGPFSREEAWDAYDITEWFAAQPWCNGNIGMFGRSYLGITQYMAASTAPPHLKAIFPEMAMFDIYSFVYPGGVFHHDFISKWSGLVKELDTVRLAAPVDEDSEGTMLAEAIEEHKANRDVYEMAASMPYRNSLDQETGSTYFDTSPSSYPDEIRKSGVAVYHLVGWYDLYTRDALVWFNNLDNPQKIVIGPWSHTETTGFDLVAEHLRWYDYWLKGIDNGVINEPPIYYYTMGAREGEEWRTARQWPLRNEKPTPYYFRSGPSGSVNSVNDGLLNTQPPTDATGQDDYIVDYTTTSGTATRWTNGYGGEFDYPDMTQNDEKGLTYTTPPLDSDIELTGHPIVYLWVTSTATDGDFFVYLEEVDEDGYSHYITEGTLRASHRATSAAPYEYMGLPYHRSFAEDVAELPGEPVELVFDLIPTSNIFDQGHHIRVTITGADKDNAQTPELSPPPTVSIYRNASYASYIILPVIPPGWPIWAIVLIVIIVAVLLVVVFIKFVKKPA